MGTVTFLFTDVADSTRLWEEHPESMKDALAAAQSLRSERMVYNAREILILTLRIAGRLDEAERVLEERSRREKSLGFEHRPGETAFIAGVLAMDRG